jgi:hypothetical protein
LTINAMGQPPGPLFIHAGDDLSKTIHHVLERVDVVVENDDFGFRIALCGFFAAPEASKMKGWSWS